MVLIDFCNWRRGFKVLAADDAMMFWRLKLVETGSFVQLSALAILFSPFSFNIFFNYKNMIEPTAICKSSL